MENSPVMSRAFEWIEFRIKLPPAMRGLTSALVPALILVGCASSGLVIEPVPTGRIEFPGYSFLPPPGPGWQMVRNDEMVLLRKEIGPETHTLAMSVVRHTGFDPGSAGYAEYATDPDVFAAYARASAEQANPASGRMRILQHEVEPTTRFGYCARQYMRAEDHGSVFAPRVLVQEDWSYSCLHPDSVSVIIEIGFSERALPGESDSALAGIREQFFDSFRFANASVVPTADVNESRPEQTSDVAADVLSSAAETPAIVFVVKHSLRDAVLKAAEQNPPPMDFSFEGDLKASRDSYTIQLNFSSVVDRASQTQNRDGAVIGGLPTLLLGAITPWVCPTTHTLSAVVTDPGGKQLKSYQLEEKEKRVGTMLMCGDIEDPGKSIIVKLVSELLQRITDDKILP